MLSFLFFECLNQHHLLLVVAIVVFNAFFDSFAIRFDQMGDGTNMHETEIISQCNDARPDLMNIDISEKTFINYNRTEMALDYALDVMDTRTFIPNENDQFASDISSSRSWIISLVVSSLMSMIIFSPILIYLKQYFKILTWNPDKVDETYYFTQDEATQQ